MFHFGEYITQNDIEAPGQIFAVSAPFDQTNFPDGCRLFGIAMQVPDSVSEDFTYDIRWQGDSIFTEPQNFDASASTQVILLDLHFAGTSDPITLNIFEQITFHVLSVPGGGIPAGMILIAMFDDGVEVASDATIAAAIDAHEAASNPHPQYLTEAEADALYEPLGGGSGGGAAVEADFITGFELRKTGNQEVTISPGAAYVPDVGDVIRTNADIAISPSHAAGLWYFYLYDSGGGVGAIEASQTAPVFYRGDAQHKTGDDSRRFVGYALSDGVAWFDFKAQARDKEAIIIWEAAGYNSGWSLVVGGTSESNGGTALSIANHAPPGVAIMHLLVRLFAGANNETFVGINGRAIPADASPAGYWGSEVLLEHWNATGTAGIEKILPVQVHLDRGATDVYYRYHDQVNNGGSVSIYVRAVTYRR